MIIFLLAFLKLVFSSNEYQPVYCSSVQTLDPQFILNTSSRRCDYSCVLEVLNCYFISGVTTCFPPKRVSNSFIPSESEVTANVTNQNNETETIVLPGVPDNSTSNEEIFYNGQWLTKTQWVYKEISYCKINYQVTPIISTYTSIADRPRVIRATSRIKRSEDNVLDSEQAFVGCNASTSSNTIYNNLNTTIGTVLNMNDQCTAFTFVPSSSFYINSVSLWYTDTGFPVNPLTAYVMTHIVETTYNILCFAQTTENYNGSNIIINFNFTNCYIPHTLLYNYTVTIGFTCDNDRTDCAANTSKIVRSQSANTNIDSAFAYGPGTFKTLSSSDCFTSNPTLATNMSGGIRGFSINAGLCTQAPTSAPTTSGPTKAPTSAPTQYPTFSPGELIIDAGVDVYHTWEQPILKLITNSEKTLDVWLSKPGINFMYECNNTCTIIVPDNFYITGDDFILWVYDNNSLVYTNNFGVESYISCPIPINPFSPLWIQSWSCFGTLGQFILVSSIIGFCAIAAAILVVVGLTVYITGYCLTNRNNATVINNISLATDGLKESLYNTMDKASTTGGRPGVFSGYDVLIIFLALPLIVSAGPMLFPACSLNMSAPNVTINACQYSFSMGAQDIICNGGICEVNFNRQITFALVGQTICLNFVTESGTIFSTLQMTYLMHVRTVKLTYDYATYSWNPFSSSNKGCASTSICPLSGCPAPPTALNPSSSNLVFDSYAIAAFPSFLNQTYINSIPSIPNLDCSASCGCAGCGCFFCSSGCMWAYYRLDPTGDIFNVFTPSVQYSYPVLSGFFYRPGSNCYDSLIDINFKTSTISTITPGSPFARVNIDVSNSATSTGPQSPYLINVVLISSVVTQDISFGDNKVICNMNTAQCFYGFASHANTPSIGVPGDIQYSVNLNSPQIWNPLSVIKSNQQSSVAFSFPPVGARFMTSSTNPYPSFPVDFGSVTYSISNYNMIGLDAAPGPLTIGLNTLAPYQVTYTDTTICPEILLVVPPSGCSSCDLGATVSISIRSTCSAGLVFLILSGPGELGTTSSYAGTSSSVEIITFYPSEETASFSLTASYKGKNSTIKFEGFFPRMSLLDNGTWITQNNESSVTTTNNIGSWWDNQGIGFKVGISFSVGIGLFIIVGLIVGLSVLLVYLRN